MIKNDKQLREAKTHLKAWRDSFESMRKSLAAPAFAVYKETHMPMVEQVQKDIDQYETLKNTEQEPAVFDNPMDVGGWLIRERIRRGMTQIDLGKKIGLGQSQVSREEEQEYRNSSLMRIHDIFSVFGYPLFELTFFKKGEEKKLADSDLTSGIFTVFQVNDANSYKEFSLSKEQQFAGVKSGN